MSKVQKKKKRSVLASSTTTLIAHLHFLNRCFIIDLISNIEFSPAKIVGNVIAFGFS